MTGGEAKPVTADNEAGACRTPSLISSDHFVSDQGALKGTDPQRRLSEKTADFCRFAPSPGNSSIWRAQKAQIFAESTDFRRKPKIFTENRRKAFK